MSNLVRRFPCFIRFYLPAPSLVDRDALCARPDRNGIVIEGEIYNE